MQITARNLSKNTAIKCIYKLQNSCIKQRLFLKCFKISLSNNPPMNILTIFMSLCKKMLAGKKLEKFYFILKISIHKTLGDQNEAVNVLDDSELGGSLYH